MGDAVRSLVDSVCPEIVALRHALHQHPEIRFEEEQTSQRIAAFLDGLGIPYERGYAKGTGIVATLSQGEGPTVALRADMDALEITEATGLPYASQVPGKMHACGHDGHMAVLCGVAKVLASMDDRPAGCIKFIFQPAEEMAAGGKFMVEEGALDGVDAAFALHGWPGLSLGSVGLRSGPLMASGDFFRVRIHGRGGHAAHPGECIDPVLIVSQCIDALQSLASRDSDPCEAGVVTVTLLEGGTAGNIIPDTAGFGGTFRALELEDRDRLWAGIQKICGEVAAAHGATAEVKLCVEPYPPLHNDPKLTQFTETVLRDALSGMQLVDLERPYMTSEDFAFYANKVPSCFLLLGVDDGGEGAQLHTDGYDFNDGAIPHGMEAISRLALRFLEAGPVA